MFVSVLITIVALFFRLIYPDIYEFKADEAISLFLASRLYFGHALPPGSTTSSIGILNPPLFIYLLAPFTFISRHPAFITAIIAITNALAIGWFTQKLKKFYPNFIAHTTGLLLAVLPWSVLFSRKIWTQDLILPFIYLCIIFAHEIIQKNTPKSWTLLILFTLLAAQLYLLSLLVLGPLCVLLFIRHKPKDLKKLIWPCMAGLLPLLPFMSYIASGGIVKTFALPPGLEPWYGPFQRMGQIISQGGFSALFGTDYIAYVNKYHFTYQTRVILYLQYILAPLGLILTLKDTKFHLIYASWLLGFFLTLVLPIPSHIHYFIPYIPILCFSTAYTLYLIYTKIHKYLGVALSALIVFVAVYQTYTFLSYINTKGSLAGEYGDTIRTGYKPDSHFQEEDALLLHIPMEAFNGTYPMATMLYGKQFLTTAEDQLWNKAIQSAYKSPERYMLYTHLTQSPVTPDILLNLRTHKQSDPHFIQFYLPFTSQYQSRNFRKIAEIPSLGIWLSYPEHWQHVEKIEKRFEAYSDDIKINVNYFDALCQNTDCQKLNTIDSTEKISETLIDDYTATECFSNTYWCGTNLLVSVGREKYTIQAYSINRTASPTQYSQIKNGMISIATSMRKL